MEQNAPVVVDVTKAKNGRGLKIATAVMTVLAIGGVSFGVYGMMQKNNISEQKVQIRNSDGTVTEVEKLSVETKTENGSTVTVVDVPSAKKADLDHYIYVAQWGIKIKFPEDLKTISYRYNEDNGYTGLEVTGVDCSGGCQYGPEFAYFSKTNASMGAILRLYKDDNVESLIGKKLQKVTTIGDYSYYYEHPQTRITSNDDELEWENKSVQMIEKALTDSNNYSAL